MGKRDELLSRMQSNPKDIRFDEIRNLLLYFGFTERQPSKGSSHFTFRYRDNIITVPKHYPINQVYVKKVLELLKDMEIIT